MSSVSSIGLKHPGHYWDLTKGKYDTIDGLVLMSSPMPVIMILIAYLIFILKIGPMYMQKRKPFNLKMTLLAYNFVQVVLSGYMVYNYFMHLRKYGVLHKKCLLDQEPTRSETIRHIHFYFMAKVSELLDTIFFVFRKKNNQVTFLHVYHHSIMMLGTWAYLKYAPSDNVVFIGFMNALVHVFMYSYYGLAALGPNVARFLWWKKYMTSFQLIQFGSMLVQYFGSLFISDCPPSKAIYTFFILNILTFIFLFYDFYKKSYAKKGSKSSANGITNGITNGIKKEIANGIAVNGDSSKLKEL